ncbi:unnamed protein product [Urochloa humidicola]
MTIGSPPATIETVGLDAGQKQPTEAGGNLQEEEEEPAHTLRKSKSQLLICKYKGKIKMIWLVKIRTLNLTKMLHKKMTIID